MRFITQKAERLSNLYPVTPEAALGTLSLCRGNADLAEAIFQLCTVAGPYLSPMAVAAFVMGETREASEEA